MHLMIGPQFEAKGGLFCVPGQQAQLLKKKLETHLICDRYDGFKNEMAATLMQKCHFNKINDIAFPHNYSDLFATASTNDIRLWNLKEMKELLRIQVVIYLSIYLSIILSIVKMTTCTTYDLHVPKPQ
jgi:hypothetical protein